MKILKSDLSHAAQQGIISTEQSNHLWTFLESKRPDQARFKGLHVLYYFGGVLFFASMSWFLTTAWSDGVAIQAVSGLFALLYVVIGNHLWAQRDLKIPGGLLITAAVGLAPVFIYGVQKATGFLPQETSMQYADYHLWIRGTWIFMEIGTVVAALIALRFFRFPFITFPLAFTLWYMSMDLTPILFGKNHFDFDERKIVSCIFGFCVLVGSYIVDRKYKEDDFAFWTYLYGMLAFWGGLSLMDSQNEWSRLVYCLLNVGLIIASVYLRRKVFIVFGTLGVLGYLGHLAWTLFKDSYALPIVLSILGISIILLGVQIQKNKAQWEALIERHLPLFLLKWRPSERV